MEAEGSTEAVEICRTFGGKIDLILLDVLLYPPAVQMDTRAVEISRLHGDQLVAILRGKRPLSRILVMSATTPGRLGGRGMGWLTRQYPFIQKPFTADALLHTVQDVLVRPAGAFKPSYGTWDCRRR
jgi:hypothetical protein